MKVRIGCDITNIARFKELDKKALLKVFHPSELKHKKPETLAGIFAAKESCIKVFNDLRWLDIEVIKQRNGKPRLLLNYEAAILSSDLSISHDGDYAIASVVFLIEK